jgi:hypothetical protein
LSLGQFIGAAGDKAVVDSKMRDELVQHAAGRANLLIAEYGHHAPSKVRLHGPSFAKGFAPLLRQYCARGFGVVLIFAEGNEAETLHSVGQPLHALPRHPEFPRDVRDRQSVRRCADQPKDPPVGAQKINVRKDDVETVGQRLVQPEHRKEQPGSVVGRCHQTSCRSDN